MKSRRVVVSLEIETDAKVKQLRTKHFWDLLYVLDCTIFDIMEKPKVTVVKLKK